MNTSNMIPISYVKSITPLVVGDICVNVKTHEEFKIADHDHEISINEYEFDFFNSIYLKSFEDRPNTGKQPVGVGVDVVINNGSKNKDKAASFIWNVEYTSSITKWQPNHAAMLSDYKKTQELKEGETIRAVYSSLPRTMHPQYDLGSPLDRPSDGQCNGKIDTEDAKPVFSQAMADAGELPPVGSLILVDSPSDIAKFIDVEVMYISETLVVINDGAYDISFNPKTHKMSPIDTRSDEEKLRDAMYLVVSNDYAPEDIELLLSSGKFTITLNEVGE